LTVLLSPWSCPRKYFFQLLAHFTSNGQEREKLNEFCTPEGQEELWDYCYKPKRTCFEIIEDFPFVHGKLPADYIFDLFPLISERDYSISGSGPHSLDLCVALVEYKTRMRTPRQGVCSQWIKQLQTGDTVIFKVSPGTFTLPQDPSSPVILIGPGTFTIF
jgi:sulfite reductase alpha subunit-like flavoprotein